MHLLMRPTVAKQWFNFSSRLAREEALQNYKMFERKALREQDRKIF